jgi:hypothetical protein
MAIRPAHRPIFVTGSERSGTTLIMTILGCHPDIAVPEVTWYYPRFRPYLFTYGELTRPDNFRTLVNEMAYGLRKPFFGLDVNPAAFGDEVHARAVDLEQSFGGVFAAMLETFAAAKDKPRWGEKTPYNLFYIGEIIEDFPTAHIVYITRDGRDVCAEFLDASFGPTNIFAAAELWDMGQKAVRPWRQSLGADQWYDLSYEALVHAPQSELQKVCEFLGVDYAPAMLNFHATETAQRRGQTRDNAALGQPISDKYVGRYVRELSLRDQQIFASVAGDTMRELGYIDLADPVQLTAAETDHFDEMDGRFRAASLDAPDGWIVLESYNDWLIDQREARRKAGLWSTIPDPAPFPLGHKHEEYFSGMRAQRRWKTHFSVKREYSQAKAVL